MNTTSHHSNNSNNNNNNSNNTSHHIKQEQQFQFHPQQQQIVDNFSSQLPPLQTRGYSPNNNIMYRSIDTPQPSPLIPQSPPQPASHVVETVSLKSMHQDEYYFRNLAITNTFTFRDLLAEIEIIGSPPPGKRVVISDNDRVIYPMDQPIQSVIRKPPMTHIELSLGLLDQPSINWGDFNNTEA
jgi:hypothetical protein